MTIPTTQLRLLLVLLLVTLLGLSVESSALKTSVCGPESRLKYPAKRVSLPTALDMHAYQAALALLEKLDTMSSAVNVIAQHLSEYEAVGYMPQFEIQHLLEYEPLHRVLLAYTSSDRPALRYFDAQEALYMCVQDVLYSGIYAAERNEVRPELERCTCSLMRRQLSRALVSFFACELENVDADQFPSLYRDNVARLNFPIHKRMVLSDGGATVLEQYGALFHRCVHEPLARVAKPLVIEFPEALKPTATEQCRRQHSHDENETSEAAGGTEEANAESSKGTAKDETSAPEGVVKTTTRVSKTSTLEGSESSNCTTYPANAADQAAEIPVAAGDTTNAPANKTASSPEWSADQPGQTLRSPAISEDPMRELENHTPTDLENTESLNSNAFSATSEAGDPEDRDRDETKALSAVVDVPSSPVSTAPEPNASKEPPTQSPVATAAAAAEDTASHTAKSEVDSPPDTGSENSLFWVLLSCVAVLALGLLLVLVGDRIRRNTNQWIPLVDLDSYESSDSYQVAPELTSSHDEPELTSSHDEPSVDAVTSPGTLTAVAELVDETLVPPPSSP